MADEDWYISQGRARMQQISAARASAVADLEIAKANYDDDSAATAIQTIADLDAQRANLSNLYDSYIRSITPPPREEVTDAERLSKPWNKMSWDDALAIYRTSKYGKDLNWNDPNMQAAVRDIQRRNRSGG